MKNNKKLKNQIHIGGHDAHADGQAATDMAITGSFVENSQQRALF